MVPYLIGVKRGKLLGPLSQFQDAEATESGTRKLLVSIARASSPPWNQAQERFQLEWPKLKKELARALRRHAAAKRKGSGKR